MGLGSLCSPWLPLCHQCSARPSFLSSGSGSLSKIQAGSGDGSWVRSRLSWWSLWSRSRAAVDCAPVSPHPSVKCESPGWGLSSTSGCLLGLRSQSWAVASVLWFCTVLQSGAVCLCLRQSQGSTLEPVASSCRGWRTSCGSYHFRSHSCWPEQWGASTGGSLSFLSSLSIAARLALHSGLMACKWAEGIVSQLRMIDRKAIQTPVCDHLLPYFAVCTVSIALTLSTSCPGTDGGCCLSLQLSIQVPRSRFDSRQTCDCVAGRPLSSDCRWSLAEADPKCHWILALLVLVHS